MYVFWQRLAAILSTIFLVATLVGTATADTTVPLNIPHDARYFPQTGYRIDNGTIWNYFTHRGSVPTFGYPTSRTFTFQGFTVQFFQRRIVQLGPDGSARLLNLLDPGLLPYTSFNGSTFPAVDAALTSQAPAVGSPGYDPAIRAFVREHALDTFDGIPVRFYQTFTHTVTYASAYPQFSGSATDANPTPSSLNFLVTLNLEMWGIPTSQPMVDVNNHNFIYLRFERGIMMYDASCSCTQGVLLGDYLKDILTGQDLPTDLAQEAANSPFLDQYDPNAPNWVHTPSLLPNTDLTNAFTPE